MIQNFMEDILRRKERNNCNLEKKHCIKLEIMQQYEHDEHTLNLTPQGYQC